MRSINVRGCSTTQQCTKNYENQTVDPMAFPRRLTQRKPQYSTHDTNELAKPSLLQAVLIRLMFHPRRNSPTRPGGTMTGHQHLEKRTFA